MKRRRGARRTPCEEVPEGEEDEVLGHEEELCVRPSIRVSMHGWTGGRRRKRKKTHGEETRDGARAGEHPAAQRVLLEYISQELRINSPNARRTHDDARNARVQRALLRDALAQVVAHRDGDDDVDERRRREGRLDRPCNTAGVAPSVHRGSIHGKLTAKSRGMGRVRTSRTTGLRRAKYNK